MSRYFIEVSYKGTRYAGFQVQENAVTIQSEVERALSTLHRRPVPLTGSSRTDAGVHAMQNYFHFDIDGAIHAEALYKLNAILPGDIVVRSLHLMPMAAHSRFDAIGREYVYKIHRFKNPFLHETSLYYPYKLDMALLHESAAFIATKQNFFPFSKTNTQVKNFTCTIYKSEWKEEGEHLAYYIKGNRFLRGMVRMLTATMLKVGRSKIPFEELDQMFQTQRRAIHSAPAHGLFLRSVEYPHNYFTA